MIVTISVNDKDDKASEFVDFKHVFSYVRRTIKSISRTDPYSTITVRCNYPDPTHCSNTFVIHTDSLVMDSMRYDSLTNLLFALGLKMADTIPDVGGVSVVAYHQEFNQADLRRLIGILDKDTFGTSVAWNDSLFRVKRDPQATINAADPVQADVYQYLAASAMECMLNKFCLMAAI